MKKKPLVYLTAIPLLLVIVPAAGWLYSEHRYSHAVLPPHGAATLADFAKTGFPTRDVRRFSLNGSMYFALFGDPPRRVLTFPSGPPVYIFDAQGAFIAWTRDRGDDPTFQARWQGHDEGASMSLNEAVAATAP